MFSILEIVRRDAATYYRYETDNRISRVPAILLFAVTSLIAGFTITVASNDFLAGALSAQAILVGFTFNVLFFLVANRLAAPSTWLSIEHRLRFERLTKLSGEIFDNVSYFNIVAIFSVLTAITLLLVGSESLADKAIKLAHAVYNDKGKYEHNIRQIFQIIGQLTLSTLIFMLIESGATFLRTVIRIRFYFSMLKLMDEDNKKAD